MDPDQYHDVVVEPQKEINGVMNCIKIAGERTSKSGRNDTETKMEDAVKPSAITISPSSITATARTKVVIETVVADHVSISGTLWISV